MFFEVAIKANWIVLSRTGIWPQFRSNNVRITFKHESITIRTGKRVCGWDMRVCEGWDD